MEYLINFISSATGAAGSQIIQSALDMNRESEDHIAVEQTIALGLVKSYGVLFPELVEIGDSLTAFVRDFEKLRHAGISNDEARNIVQFIYFPRTYLIHHDHLPEEVVTDLNSSQIDKIVDNSFRTFLNEKDVSIDSDLDFHVAGLEGDEHILELL